MKHEQREFSDLIEQWRNDNKVHSLEGSEGIKKFEKLLKIIGYGDGNHFNDVLRNFLSDNSGALECLMEWITDADAAEWKESLMSELPEEKDEDEDEE